MEQILTNLQAHLPETLSIVTVVLYILGSYLKMTPNVKDWTIPYFLMLAGAIFSCGIQKNIEMLTILQGCICGITAVGANQLKVQYGKKDKDKVEEKKETKTEQPQ